MAYPNKKAERLKRQYPPGTRLQLERLCNAEPGMPSGLRGTVTGCDDQSALLMEWDNGRTLSLFPEEDSFTVVPREQERTPDEPLCDRKHGGQPEQSMKVTSMNKMDSSPLVGAGQKFSASGALPAILQAPLTAGITPSGQRKKTGSGTRSIRRESEERNGQRTAQRFITLL